MWHLKVHFSVNFFIGICSEDEKEFKFYQIKTSEYLNFFIWKKFHEEPNITICSQVSDMWTGREFFIPFVFFFRFLC